MKASGAAAAGGRRRVIKRIAGHGHHGGAWKIAYADFVTAMMALFMVLWLLASTDPKSRAEISRYFRTGILPNAELAARGGAQYVPPLMENTSTPPPGQASLEQAKSLEKSIREIATNHAELANIASRVRVITTAEGTLIEIVDEDGDGGLLFDSASARLKPSLEEFLETLTPILAERAEPIEIVGHTDARPFPAGATRSNWELSYERAAAARKIFEARGLPADRVVGVVGRGSATLLDPKRPYSATNRRLSVFLRKEMPTGGADPVM